MPRILFATWDGGGNLPPALGVARELKARGHEVTFIGHAALREQVEAQGYELTAYATAAVWRSTEPFGPDILRKVFLDPGIGVEVAAAAGAADLTVVDCLLHTATARLQAARRRHALLFHMFFARPLETWSAGPPAELAAADGVNPPELWRAADRLLVATLPELDPAAGADLLPSNGVYTGPVWPDPAGFLRAATEPRILVSLSTIHQPGQLEALQRVLDALEGLGVPATLTSGPAIDPAALRAPAGVDVRRYVPHAELLSRATLVVGHGGHSTTTAALGYGLPLLIIPMSEQADQRMVAGVVEGKGAGLSLDKTASATEIRAALERLLREPAYARAAERLGERIRARDGAVEAADQLEALLPVSRSA
jgi:UDP:flavonoid glycosyltransferase YjiC (YdhE family)